MFEFVLKWGRRVNISLFFNKLINIENINKIRAKFIIWKDSFYYILSTYRLNMEFKENKVKENVQHLLMLLGSSSTKCEEQEYLQKFLTKQVRRFYDHIWKD